MAGLACFSVVFAAGFALGAFERRGHKVEQGVPRTSANSLAVTPQGMIGAADQRTRGSLAAGH